MPGIPFNLYGNGVTNSPGVTSASMMNPVVQAMLEQRMQRFANPVSPAQPQQAPMNPIAAQMAEQQMMGQPQEQPQQQISNPIFDQMQEQATLRDQPQQINADPNMSSVAMEASVLPEEPPPEEGGLYSFLDKPGASDALVAFGASMLKAPDFNTGLADGATAVNQVARDQRMPTQQEIARAMLKSKLLRSSVGGTNLQKGEMFLGPDKTTTFAQIFDPDSGYVYQNAQTGEKMKSLPPGSMRIQNSGIGEANKQDVKVLEEARTAAKTAEDMSLQLNEIKKMIPTAGIDQGILADTKRQITDLIGREVFEGFNPADKTSVTKVLREFELGLAQTQKGLGQFTEMERQIVREALPQLDSNPDAFRRIIGMLEIRSQRAMDLYNSWMEMSPEDRASHGSFSRYSVEWKRDNRDAYESDLRDAFEIGTSGSKNAPVQSGGDAAARANSYY